MSTFCCSTRLTPNQPAAVLVRKQNPIVATVIAGHAFRVILSLAFILVYYTKFAVADSPARYMIYYAA